ncbi:unnamed protein product [Candidula unifasciata]|uniref:Zinc finger CCCH domain-containing protein 14 n=1 Tax=Candidula unifasciata TaxID=100452 RepID=A0A8S3Z9V0_9EUPU|nr:unnamed protein product [Candidula unifasciata]
MDTRTSISSRLGRLVMERPGSFDVEGVFDVGNSRTGDIMASSELQDALNDAATQGKVNLIERLGNKSQNASRIYQEQPEKDFISEQALQTCRKKRKNSKCVSQVVSSDIQSQFKYIERTVRGPEGKDVVLQHRHSQGAPAGLVKSSNLGGSDDPAEQGGDEDQEHLQLVVEHVADDCTLDSAASDTKGGSVGGDGEKHQTVVGPRKGTTFIVTLDGVDESQFDSKNVDEVHSGCEIAQSRQSAFEKVHAEQLENSGTMFRESNLGQFEDSGTMPEKFRCPAASVTVTPVVPSVLKQLWQEQKLLLDLEAARSEHLILQQVQSLKWAAVVPELLSLKPQHTLLEVKDFDADTDEIAVEDHGTAEDIADEEDGSSAYEQPKLERCKFWPVCAAGGSCGYYHPTAHCKMFPKCRFGDKCLFIHPNCRFDSRCARPDCPYTHNSRRQSACISSASFIRSQSHFVPSPQPYKPHLLQPAFSSSQPTCRYFPNCKNRNCLFTHPKLCRFGLACTNLSCPFFHPYMPNKKMLKWQNHCGKVKEVSLETSSRIRTTVSRGPGSTKTSRPTTVSSTSQ